MAYDDKARERSGELIALNAYLNETVSDLENVFGIKFDGELMALFMLLKDVLKKRIVLKDE